MLLISRAIATGLYVGYAPYIPGTVGSLLGLFLYWAVPGTESTYFLYVILVLLFIGAWSATQVEKQTGITDNQIIVIDEIAGIFITLFLFEKRPIWLMIGLFLFRFFDIIKLFPANKSERLPSGWGVMMDDVVAGVYSAASLRLLFQIAN